MAANAWEEVRELAHKIQSPVTDSLMGKGVFSGTDPYYTGMLGMHGTKASNLGVTKCDLLIAIGSRFSDRVIGNARNFARYARKGLQDLLLLKNCTDRRTERRLL